MTFAVYLQFLHANVTKVPPIRPKPFTATCFLIHYLPIILSFNATLVTDSVIKKG